MYLIIIMLLISLVFNLLFLNKIRVQKIYIKEMHKSRTQKMGIINAQGKIKEFLNEGVNNHE